MATVATTDNDSASMGGGTTLSLTLDIGTNGGNDILYFVLGARSVSNAQAFTGLTVDGVAATLAKTHFGTNGGGITCVGGIFAIARNSLPDPAQTNVDIVATADQNCIRGACAAFVSPDASVAAATTGQDNGDAAPDTLVGSLNTSAGSIVLGCYYSGDGSLATQTWTGLTEAATITVVAGSDNQFGSAEADNVSAETPRVITIELSEATQAVLVTASFPPAAAAGTPEPASRRMMQGKGGITGGMQMKRRENGLYVPEKPKLYVPGFMLPKARPNRLEMR